MELEGGRAIGLFCFALLCFEKKEEAIVKLIKNKCIDGLETKTRIQETVSKQFRNRL